MAVHLLSLGHDEIEKVFKKNFGACDVVGFAHSEPIKGIHDRCLARAVNVAGFGY
jgi:hypothetical protein